MKLTLFGVKSTLILNDAIVTVDTTTSYIHSTGYSFWSSDLNQTTRIARSPHHVPYSVTLSTKGVVISCLPTRAPFRKPREPPNQGFLLYTTFVVYLTTIGGQYLKTKNYQRLKETEILYSVLSETISFNCLTKLRSLFETVKFYKNFFFNPSVWVWVVPFSICFHTHHS